MHNKIDEFKNIPVVSEVPEDIKYNLNDEQLKMFIDQFNDKTGIKLSIPKESFRVKEIIESLNEKYKFRYNTITQELEFHNGKSDKFQLLDKRSVVNIHTELILKNFRISKEKFRDIVGSKFISEDFNPFHHFLNSLPKYGGNRDFIRDFLSSVQLEDETEREMFVEYFSKWITAAVASWAEEGVANHECLVLVGGEGIFKTTWLNNLLPKKLQIDYLYSNRFDFENKDHIKYLGTKFIVNLDELSSFTRTDQNLIKTVLTETRVVLRLPWGEVDSKMWRKASFCGSSNEYHFLKDETSSRRFLVFKIKGIDIDNDSVSIEDVYSQAFALYKSGFKYWFDSNENKTINERNRFYHSSSIEEDLVIEYLKVPTEDDIEAGRVEYMTTTAVNNFLMSKVNKANMNETTLRRTGLIMKKLKFPQFNKRINSHPTRVWAVRKAEWENMIGKDNEAVF